MKLLRRGVLAFVISLSLSVQANPHSFTGTIDTPPVAVWVDSAGTTIAPFFATLVSMLYVDPSTGFVWTIQNVRSTTPSLIGYIGGRPDGDLGLLYSTTNCTGTAYLNASFWTIPHTVFASASDGQLYADGAPASATIHSRSVSGTCYVETVPGPVYLAIGPLTPPTLPAGPWHLEIR